MQLRFPRLPLFHKRLWRPIDRRGVVSISNFGCCCGGVECFCGENETPILIPDQLITLPDPVFSGGLGCCSGYDGESFLLDSPGTVCNADGQLDEDGPLCPSERFSHTLNVISHHIDTFDTAYCTLRYILTESLTALPRPQHIWALAQLKGTFDWTVGQSFTLPYHSSQNSPQCTNAGNDVTVDLV